VLFAGDGLLERVAAEGELSPVDVVLTVDIGNLVGANEQGLTQPITTPAVERVPAEFRDADGGWVALSLRARVFYVSKDRVTETALAYEDIAEPEWKGRLVHPPGRPCLQYRAHRQPHRGLGPRQDTRLADRRARQPRLAALGSDRAQVKAILEGTCDLAIGNTYYMGLMLTNEAEPEQKDWAAAARIVYPDAEGDGTQVNAAGAFIARHAPNAENANRLIEFLLSDEAQQLYADANFEFPAVTSVAPAELTLSWGALNPSPVSLVEVAAHRGRGGGAGRRAQVQRRTAELGASHRPDLDPRSNAKDRQWKATAGRCVCADRHNGSADPVAGGRGDRRKLRRPVGSAATCCPRRCARRRC
jgi:iron(III) transport system substrate-binding protein